jgi:hypothetical protein
MPACRASGEAAPEIVRLAGVMYRSMGVAASASWRTAAVEEVRTRLGRDLAALLVDRSSEGQGLCGSGCGPLARRLPPPANPAGLVGYLQRVATDPEYRRGGQTALPDSRRPAWDYR